MTKELNDGGPAFPAHEDRGMSLRDYFAAKAMEAEITAGAIAGAPDSMVYLAGWCYQMADAMLAAREAK